MKKIAIVLLLAMSAVIIFTGCGDAGTAPAQPGGQAAEPAGSADSADPTDPADPSGPVTVTVIRHMGEQAKRDGLQAWVDTATAANPLYRFEVSVIADANQYRQLIRTRIVAGDPADVMFGAVRDYLDMVEAGNVADIADASFIGNFAPDIYRRFYSKWQNIWYPNGYGAYYGLLQQRYI